MPNQLFYKQLETGKIGENKVANWLESRGWHVRHIDDLKEQKKGIDFIVTKKDRIFTVEVKYDIRSLDTGNFYIETEKPLWGTLGWFHTTQADYLFMLNDKMLYIVKPQVIRDYFNTRKYGTVKGGAGESIGYLLRENQLRKMSTQVVYLDGEF